MVAASADETAITRPNTPRGASDRMALPLVSHPKGVHSFCRGGKHRPMWVAYHSQCRPATRHTCSGLTHEPCEQRATFSVRPRGRGDPDCEKLECVAR